MKLLVLFMVLSPVFAGLVAPMNMLVKKGTLSQGGLENLQSIGVVDGNNVDNPDTGSYIELHKQNGSNIGRIILLFDINKLSGSDLPLEIRYAGEGFTSTPFIVHIRDPQLGKWIFLGNNKKNSDGSDYTSWSWSQLKMKQIPGDIKKYSIKGKVQLRLTAKKLVSDDHAVLVDSVLISNKADVPGDGNDNPGDGNDNPNDPISGFTPIDEESPRCVYNQAYQENYENDKIDDTPLPPGSIFIGDRNFGTWRKNQQGEKQWQFYRVYRHLPNYLGWGKFRPTYKFYQEVQVRMNNKKSFYGFNDEFGVDGELTKQYFSSYFKRSVEKKIDFKAFFKDYLKRNF